MENKVEIKVAIDHGEVIYQIQNTTHKLWLFMKAGEQNLEQAYQIQADDGEMDMSLVRTAIDTHVSQMQRISSAYIKTSAEVAATGAKEKVVSISFEFPESWKIPNEKNLRTGINDYIVNGALFEYLKHILPNNAATYLKMAEEAEARIRSAIHARVKPIKKPLSVL